LAGTVVVGDVVFQFGISFMSISAHACELIAQAGCNKSLALVDPGFRCNLYLPGREIVFGAYSTLTTGDVILVGQIQDESLPTIASFPDLNRFSASLHPDGCLSIIQPIPGQREFKNDQ
jgi:hypothetical protein